ncbi:hypothetical protein A2757_01865 [Candidatus Giovannonibacteria bacterium RIFCSPHIGHO2_01_FULL_48_47]|nr:MAG: hypothetical protein A2757_01865 [Candidatus Giovannonibacteria bacterium RIFCSPHIGHO2_01_FULL_48_47]OGF68449.1 MAG: hypothetical protein A3D61_01060 [Candidatus Giovannonibacteria bacterium RIFCSPHIGHO2_02_FULL_48_15]OGF88745.1 MAG: hypothetical protein A3B26_00680 [Candidatus Giovannonibacteria bacterium RIFCSPLOWO2_01_FULL_48_47]OGF96093.1 MAG: hypothetical protein A2613_00805 [Candidatus Giovannonibacteria bacterium RIFOXYD1_FULL_48_21]HBT81384.1 hypothetical protein [Candidatus Gio
MQLKRLELSGFKSFAKNTLLEFPVPISAVVGPNGSGKSNVADAIRWVLGEQSIKSLRGKRGEDLIFAGSSNVSRMPKASAVLVFDNAGREFPLEPARAGGFEEVSIGRRVYRDGLNDYLINGSEVRLKDIVELLAKVGFGSSQHHIIGQGEADRILYSSPSERREMIEDALGLKIFHLRRMEAGRKLERASENIQQVEALRKEIQPHLKFLKSQAEKFKVASELREKLKSEFQIYLSRKLAMIDQRGREVGERKHGPASELKKIESEIASVRERIEREEKKEAKEPGRNKLLEEKLKKAREDEMASLRELGRLEGVIAVQERGSNRAVEEVVPKKDVEKILSALTQRVDQALKENALEKILAILGDIKKSVFEFLQNLPGQKKTGEFSLEDNKKGLSELKLKIERLQKEGRELSEEYEREASRARKEAEETRKDEKRFYHLELEAGKLKDALRSIELEEEKVKLLRDEYGRELEEARAYTGGEIAKGEPFSSPEELEDFRKKLERIKIKLEEAGGIDPAVLKEYREISSRDEFLDKELSDLTESREKLREVMKELEDRLKHDFKSGVSKINEEFQKFFHTMFGGGKASLKVIEKTHRKESDESEESGEVEEVEEGIDISVDLPRKRIKSLEMLSGGERALTSIALLFAVSAVHPPPFLVLDETDAALDEANSQRYAKMLEDLSKTTQLIVITHNRTTMKYAGILYGVTMGSDGVSKLLSIKFEEAGALVS